MRPIAVIYRIAVNASLSFLARWLDRRTRRRLGRTVQPSAADEGRLAAARLRRLGQLQQGEAGGASVGAVAGQHARVSGPVGPDQHRTWPPPARANRTAATSPPGGRGPAGQVAAPSRPVWRRANHSAACTTGGSMQQPR